MIRPGRFGNDDLETDDEYDDMARMTEEQFLIAISRMKLEADTIAAAKQVLVDGKTAKEVGETIGKNPSQIARAARNIRDNLDRIAEENEIAILETFMVPKSLLLSYRDHEAYYIAPLQKESRRPRKKKKNPS